MILILFVRYKREILMINYAKPNQNLDFVCFNRDRYNRVPLYKNSLVVLPFFWLKSLELDNHVLQFSLSLSLAIPLSLSLSRERRFVLDIQVVCTLLLF